MPQVTPATRQALEIFERFGALTPAQFAKHMWPDSDGWRKSAKCGPNGSHRGGGMYVAAGGYLGKLRKRGWLENRDLHRNTYCLTDEGRQALRSS